MPEDTAEGRKKREEDAEGMEIKEGSRGGDLGSGMRKMNKKAINIRPKNSS